MAGKVEGREDEFRFTQSVAVVQEFEGQFKAAEQTWNRAGEQAALQKAPDSQASILLSLVSGRALAGNCQNATQDVKAALALDHSKPTLVQATVTAALCNDRTDALPLIAKIAKDFPEDTIVQQVIVPESRAALAIAAHQPARKLCIICTAPNLIILSRLRLIWRDWPILTSTTPLLQSRPSSAQSNTKATI